MKLLLDENLSSRLVAQLSPAFPGSAHVDSVCLDKRQAIEAFESDPVESLLILELPEPAG